MPSFGFRLPATLLLVASLAASFGVPLAAQAPADALLLTRAERTGFVETTGYEEVVALASRLAEASDDIHLTHLGYTQEGRRLPLLVVGAPDASPEAVRATGKTRVYLQGNIHAGEVCGKEALLMLLRRFAAGAYPDWSDSLVLLVAPIYNADGNERVRLDHRRLQHGPVGGMGQRPNAMGLDLNRDHTKLDTPEARSLVTFLTRYDPHVGVDLHTTNGTRHAYHLTYAPPLHPATPAGIDDYLRDDWLPQVTRRVEEKRGWAYHHYGNAYDGPEGPGWYTFDHRPRFSNNYLGLRNRFGILSEAYAYLTFHDRIRASLWFVEEILDFASQNAGEIRRRTEEADRRSVVGRELATRARYLATPGDPTILMGAVDTLVHPYSGAPILRRRDHVVPTPMAEFVAFQPSATEVAPQAYYLPPSAEDAVRRLEAHGVTVVRYAEARELPVDRFQVDSVSVADEPFQGRRERTVWGRWIATVETLPPGSAYVSLDQPLGRLAFTLLEPASDDGFVAWGILEATSESGVALYRVPPTSSAPGRGGG